MADFSGDVLIVGGGPTGLVLALTLLQNGVPVRIIDKLSQQRVGQKGAGISPRSLELYNLLGVLPDILWESRFYPPMRSYKLPGGTEPVRTWHMAQYTEPKPAFPHLNPTMLGQDHMESLLRLHLEKYGCRVEMDTELVGFEQHADHVEAHVVKNVNGQEKNETVHLKWLVGTDGAKGSVRKTLGLKFLGETRDSEHIIVGDVHVEGLDNDHWHMWGDMTSRQVLLRPCERFDDVFTLVAGGKDVDHVKLSTDPKACVEFIYSVTDRTDLKIGDFVWLSDFRPNIRMVDKFGVGRVFVAGDAAHVHSPTGGQGMNSSVQDALNLGWKLAMVVKGLAPPSLLSTYSEERMPVIAEMLNVTTAILDKTIGYDSSANKGALETSQDEDTPWKRGGALLQLGVNYRWSSIVIDERQGIEKSARDGDEKAVAAEGDAGPDLVRAGDRAPDAPGLVPRPDFNSSGAPSNVSNLFQIFKATRHTALIFTRHPVESASIAEALRQYSEKGVQSVLLVPQTASFGVSVRFDGVDLAFKDQNGYAYAGYGVNSDSTTVVVVRPDGVIGAIVRDVEGMNRYFTGIFGVAA